MFLIDKLPARIYIGNEGEENVTQVQLDVSAWDALYPDAVYSITYVRPGETIVYPEVPSHVVHADGVLTWTPSESVLDISDYGTVVINCTKDDVKKKSAMTMFFVARSHPSSGAAPDPIADWISDATSKLAESGEATDRANAIAGTLEGIAPLWADVDISVSALGEGVAPTASIAQNETGTSITLGIPKGDTGAKGDKGNDGKPFNYRGDYNPDADPLYTKNDVVRFGGGSFVYINDVDFNEPTTSTSHWQQIASVGGQDLVDAAVAAKNTAVSAKDTAVAAAATLVGTVANGLTAKGASAYASLPTTGNEIGDYYYCSDGSPAGNYVWNGTVWYFGGTGDEGYSNLKDDLAKGNVGDETISEKKTTFFEKSSTNLIETYPINDDGELSVDVNADCIYTVNGTNSKAVKLTLLENVEDGGYVILSDNHNYNGKYFNILFEVPVINSHGNKSARSLNVTMTNSILRKEVSAVASEIVSSTDTIDGEMRIILAFPIDTYENFKTRFWIVKTGSDESFSFNEYSLKDYYNKSEVDEKITEVSNVVNLSVNSSLRFGVVTDIHADNDDTENTGLNGDDKIQLMVDAINVEHARKPLDWLFITGDINDTAGRSGGTLSYMKKFACQLQMPVILFPGNHDPHDDTWASETGGALYANYSLETEDFYFIWVDTFGENPGKTWLSHYSVYYSDGDTAYVPCKSTDDGALLIGTDIDVETVTSNIMKGWSLTAVAGNYCKLMAVEDADMYKAPSLEFVESEVEKAGDKYIILLTHQILNTTDGDTEGVMDYLNSLPNYLGSIEGHAHIFYFNKNSNTGKWKLNAGHFHVPSGGWDNVASNNYRGFCTIEIENNQLVAYKVQPTQNVSSAYEHEYDKLGPYIMAEVNKNQRATIDLTKVNKNREYSLKFFNLD